jgi:hypothetical protein
MKAKSVIFGVAVLLAAAFALQVIIGNVARAQDDAVLSRLNEILKGQQAIANDITAIRAELNIIKIRITQSQ